MSSYIDRTISLIGKEQFERNAKKHILIIGLGGVGGTALEVLYRSGFMNFTIVDSDVVDETNLNRQIMYSKVDVGSYKTAVCKSKIYEFCSDIDVKTINIHVDETNIDKLFKEPVDAVIDAIDFIPGKLAIYNHCLQHNIPFISSLGMAKRLNPELVKITTLAKTENDPLAKKIRYECRQCGLDLKKIPVVFSSEEPIDTGSELGSMMPVPSTAGLLLAKYIITLEK